MARAETIDTPTARPAAPPILAASRFGVPGQYRQTWLATLPPETPWEAIHSPQFWRLIVGKVRIGDQIEVRTDDLTRYGLFIVNFAEASTGAISLVSILEKQFDPAEFTGDATGAYVPRYLGVVDGWGVVRSEDQHVMAKNIRTQQEARSRIASEFSKPSQPRFG